MILSLEKIKKLIPHRDPFLFLDSVEIIQPGLYGIGYKKFSKNEDFFKGHFPNMPIVPGVVLIEALAQTSGVIVSNEFNTKSNQSVLFMAISKAKFRKPVYPEDVISLKVNYMNKVRNVYKFYGEAIKNDIKVCEAEFRAMIKDS